MRIQLTFDNGFEGVVVADWIFQALNENNEKCLIICTNNGTFMVSNITDADAINILAEVRREGTIDLTNYGPVHSTRLRRAELEN